MSTVLTVALIVLLIVLGVWLYPRIRDCLCPPEVDYVDVEGGLLLEYPNRRLGGSNRHPDIHITESAKQDMTKKRQEIEQYIEQKKDLRSPAGKENVGPNGSKSSIRAQRTLLEEKIKHAREEMLGVVLEQFVDWNRGVIDLHGCHVDIALNAVETFLQRLKDRLGYTGSTFAYIITGYGSSGTEPRIKPAVNRFLQNYGYKKNVDYWMINEGCFEIRVTKFSLATYFSTNSVRRFFRRQ